MRVLLEWEPATGEEDPPGWFREAGSGRRRPDGDAAREYVWG